MFRLDEQFLKDIGLDGLPEEQKKPFLQHIYSELELRVGTRLSDGLTDVQLEEFEKIIDRDQEKIQGWLAEHAPNYPDDESFKKLQQATKLESSDPRLVAEFTATKWLEVNRPDYRQVVAQVLEDLKREITANRDTIIGAQQPQQQTPQQPSQPQPPIDGGAQPPQLPNQPPQYPQ
jgi:hypothetical protein